MTQLSVFFKQVWNRKMTSVKSWWNRPLLLIDVKIWTYPKTFFEEIFDLLLCVDFLLFSYITTPYNGGPCEI